MGSGWWAGWSGGGSGAVVGIVDCEDGRGAVMVVPNGAKEAGVSGSGWMSRGVGTGMRGSGGILCVRRKKPHSLIRTRTARGPELRRQR